MVASKVNRASRPRQSAALTKNGLSFKLIKNVSPLPKRNPAKVRRLRRGQGEIEIMVSRITSCVNQNIVSDVHLDAVTEFDESQRTETQILLPDGALEGRPRVFEIAKEIVALELCGEFDRASDLRDYCTALIESHKQQPLLDEVKPKRERVLIEGEVLEKTTRDGRTVRCVYKGPRSWWYGGREYRSSSAAARAAASDLGLANADHYDGKRFWKL